MSVIAWFKENRSDIYRLVLFRLLRVLIALLFASATYIYARTHDMNDENVLDKVLLGIFIIVIVSALIFDEARRKNKS